MNRKDITYVYYYKPYFPPILLGFAFGLLIMSFLLFSVTYWAILLLLIAMLLCFSFKGFEVKQGQYRNFTAVLFFKRGKWISNPYSYITYGMEEVRELVPINVWMSFSRTSYQYTFYLLTADQTKQNSCKFVTISGKAKKVVKPYNKISEFLQLEKVKEIKQ